jgi:hypothetical protein
MGLSAAGCRIAALCPTRGHPLHSTSVVEERFAYSSLSPLESLAKAVEKSKPQIILPCDDRGVEHLHELHAMARSQKASGAELANLIEYSLGPAESYPVVSCRWNLLRLAMEEGIRVPDCRLLNTAEDLKSWQAAHPLPWVLKGDGTFGGRGVRIAQTPEAAAFHFQDIQDLFKGTRALKRAIVNRDPFWLRPWWKNRRPAIIVQSHVPGRPANCAVMCWKGEVQAGIAVEVLSSEGLTGPASVVRVIENDEMISAARCIARHLGLSGFFGLDFILEEGTGAAYLIEMNPRATPLCHLQLGKDRDLIEGLAARLLDRPAVERPSVTEKEMIAYFPQAWQTPSEFLESSFQDIPVGEPALLEALLRPWPDNSLLYRLATRLSGMAAFIGKSDASNQGVRHA